MEIQDIKSRLTLAQVLHHYNLKPDKNHRLLCPFHEDKTPSFQVYYKTHTGYCFSPNCKTHGKSLDVIDFIMYKEKISKHEAIIKAQEVAGIIEARPGKGNSIFDRAGFLQNLFTYFKNGLHNSNPAQEYTRQRGLEHEKIEIGYNSGKFHHGAKKNETLIQHCLELGLLVDKNLTSRTGEKAYGVFGKYCIVFALRDSAGQVTSLYFRSTVNEGDSKHYYLKGRSGLYPRYPGPGTERLILTEAIIDAASLLQIPGITGQHGILSCYGTNGLTQEHVTAMKGLKELKEIIFAFDADEAGDMATAKHGKELKDLFPGVKISKITLPTNEDVNSVYVAHEPDIFTHLLENRTELFFSNEPSNEPTGVTLPAPVTTNNINRQKESPHEKQKKEGTVTLEEADGIDLATMGRLDTGSPNKISYTTSTACYQVKGGLSRQLDCMKVSLEIGHLQTGQKSRVKLDLYEDKQAEKVAKEAGEKLGLRNDLIEKDLSLLAELLDRHREESLAGDKRDSMAKAIEVPAEMKEKCLHFLKQPNLISRFNKLVEKAGVTGEENNRIFLFVIATSYKMPDSLHALIQGTSGSGKTHLLSKIGNLVPPEASIFLTRVTESSFYNFDENYFSHKLLCMEDLDGLKEEAYLAFRELQSKGMLSSSTSIKTESGQIQGCVKIVRGPVASISCTTKGEIYEDNMSRIFLIAVDESKEQTRKIIEYQNNKAAGVVDMAQEKEATFFIQCCLRLLKPYQVINPYANKILLPPEAHKIRRLTELYHSYVKQVTLVNQYQRKQDSQQRLISEKEDLETGLEIMFESIILKIDELDGSLRQFYERLKEHVKKKGQGYQDYQFTQREVRQALNTSKTQLFRYFNDLAELEYIQQAGGYMNRGFRYKIIYWDDIKALRDHIKDYLREQLDKL